VRRTTKSLTLAAAAAAADVNKLLRVIKAGKVSGNKDEHGPAAYRIRRTHHVYPALTQRTDTKAPHCHATAALEVAIASLRQVGELLRGQFEATRQDREGRCA
jgi:hypothetical protein